MPLIDLQMIMSFINEKSLEQAGIIANFFAGLLLATEYFVAGDRIERLNDYLDHSTSNAYNRLSKFVKRYAKFNRKAVLIIITAVILLTIYQTIFYHSSSLLDYLIHDYSIVKNLLLPMRRILIVSLAVLAILFVILFIARSAPKRTLGALGILLYITGNILLYLHTLFR
jgi:hypothetical protein